MLQEFKEFALKGNVVDLAVAVIIGGAFGKIVTSLVEDIIMPIVGGILHAPDFTNVFVQLGGPAAATLDAAKKAGPTLAYGNFITIVINFLIIAFVLFLIIKAMSRMKKQEAAAPAAPPAPSASEVLLTEIRDLLARR
jgi:large conductance mechanosensitive channel